MRAKNDASLKAPPAPWREVVDVQIVEGPKGGRVWSLTLECGHLKPVRIPPVRFPAKLRINSEAPHRCRCLACNLLKYSGF
jgi:hypothetical protein